jgi:hypothetical protein
VMAWGGGAHSPLPSEGANESVTVDIIADETAAVGFLHDITVVSAMAGRRMGPSRSSTALLARYLAACDGRAPHPAVDSPSAAERSRPAVRSRSGRGETGPARRGGMLATATVPPLRGQQRSFAARMVVPRIHIIGRERSASGTS